MSYARAHFKARCPVDGPAAAVRAEHAAGRGADHYIAAGRHGRLPLFRGAALAGRLQQRRHDPVGNGPAGATETPSSSIFAGLYALYSGLGVCRT